MRSAAHESTLEREIERCRQEMAEIERQILAGHPDVAGLCLALHDWAQELRILQSEHEQWMSGS
jgi:TPP-dependent trihydroxycyclohexane-1,2-dione (THcHDO) dehydratase